MSAAGKFITFEGAEGAGKSTQLQLAAEYLRRQGIEVITTREPGGTPLAEQLRQILKTHQGTEKLHPETELLLMEAARSQHINEVILPALKRGCAVLCDRFYDSTTAYQGIARNMDTDIINRLNLFASGNRKPDLTLLLDLDVEVGFQRTGKRLSTCGEYDRFEAENREFHRTVRKAFLTLASAEPERFRVINAACGIDEAAEQIRGALDEFFC